VFPLRCSIFARRLLRGGTPQLWVVSVLERSTDRGGNSSYHHVMTRLLAAFLAVVLMAAGCADESVQSNEPEQSSAADANAANHTTSTESDAMAEPTAQHAAQSTPDAPPTHGSADDASQHKHTNRLINETSPYLLQHAHNPVDWYPWGEEAFEAARKQDKPIFLSIGYSTCYWCHVMERESFENPAIAQVMNKYFINIKVDREQRPDVDDIYMIAVQLFSGQGGWPMSVFLEPEQLRPFMGGTYFPAESKFGRPGFPEILQAVRDAWANQRPRIVQQAEYAATQIRQQLSQPEMVRPLGRGHVDLALSQIMQQYDQQHGGFPGSQHAPKFPMPRYLDLVMQAAWDRQEMRRAALHTLDRMAMGGMYDQVGGGFHRYSTDRTWTVPHFEKMLYDNGQLATTYAVAHEKTGDPYYAEITRETLEYVLREMTADSGAFYSAQDAEVNAREGLNYLWLPGQVVKALKDAGLADHVDFAFQVYGLNDEPNFQDPHHPDEPKRYIVELSNTPAELAEQMNIPLDVFDQQLRRVNEALLKVRLQREQPGLDDKVLAAWNGMMIAGFADGGRVLGETKYLDAAARAADFVLDTMRTDDGGLLRSSKDGEATIDAFLTDYAMMIDGLLKLHEATDDTRWLTSAKELTQETRQRFWDQSHGGYYDTLADQSDLFVRTKSLRDGALPCGNSVMANNLLTLHERTGEQRYLDDAAQTLKSMSVVLSRTPVVAAESIRALDRLLDTASADLLQPTEQQRQADPQSQFQQTKDEVDGIVNVAFTNSRDIQDPPGAALDLKITLADGWHINAPDPGHESLIPMEIKLIGVEGLELSADYPEPETFDGPVGSMNVYSGTVTIPLRVTVTGDVTGEPQLAITWQACDDQKCRAPQTRLVQLTWDEQQQ